MCVCVNAGPSHRFPPSFHPGGQILTQDNWTPKVRLISKDVATLAGNWEFTFADATKASGRSDPIEARVTIVWKRYPRVTINGKKERVRVSNMI